MHSRTCNSSPNGTFRKPDPNLTFDLRIWIVIGTIPVKFELIQSILKMTSSWPLTLKVVQYIYNVTMIIPIEFESNQNILKIWHQVDFWPWMTSKVILIYSECYWDWSCLIWARSKHFKNLTPSWGSITLRVRTVSKRHMRSSMFSATFNLVSCVGLL